MTKCIVIASSGFVFVGTRIQSTTTVVSLTAASSIRRWGTTRGLGQIALEGVTSSTVLDPTGDIEFPVTSVIAIIKCVK